MFNMDCHSNLFELAKVDFREEVFGRSALLTILLHLLLIINIMVLILEWRC